LRTGGVRAPLQGLDEDEKQSLNEIVVELKREIAAITGGRARI
jgi:4-hydroxy-tetrahydrodipicolinate synthase